MEAAAAPIRFGIISGGSQLLDWQSRCLAHLKAASAQWVVRVQFMPPLEHSSAARSAGLRTWLYGRLIRDAKATSQHTAQPLPSASEVYDLACQPATIETGSVHLDAETIAKLKLLDLDFLMYFGNSQLHGDVLSVARYGVWGYRLRAIGSTNSHPPGFWEIVNDETVTGAVLVKFGITEDTILKEGYLATASYSYAKNLDNLCFAAAKWPAIVCRSVGRVGSSIFGKSLPVEPYREETPSLGALLKLAAVTAVRSIERTFSIYLYRPIWNIGVVDAPITAFVDPQSSQQSKATTNKVRWLAPVGKGEFLADPFPVVHGGQAFIFAEEFAYQSAKGRIVAFELDGEIGTSPKPAIEEQYHLSYPYIIQDQEKLFCVPESFEAREIALYEAVEFPSRWNKAAVLVNDFAGNDSTLLRYDDKWWLFCTDYDLGHASALCIFHADELKGPWMPHSMNPVKIDVRSACPAGTPFVAGDKLYRPAQDCSKRYGWRIVINRIITLSEVDFHEEQAAIVEPFERGPYHSGTHTLSSLGQRTIVDGHRYEFYPSGMRNLIRSYGRKTLEAAGFSESAIARIKGALG